MGAEPVPGARPAAASPALATTGAGVLGTAVMLGLAALTLSLAAPPRLGSPLVWAVIVYHGLLGAVAHVGWYGAVDAVGPSRAAVFMDVQPVVGALLAAPLLGETIAPASWPAERSSCSARPSPRAGPARPGARR